MIYEDKQDAIKTLKDQGGWLIYFPVTAANPESWEHTIDDGYMIDLHRESGSPLDWESWASELTEIAVNA